MQTLANSPWRARVRGGLAGLIAAAVLFSVAELFAAFFPPVASPLTSVGSTFIDFTPPWLKNFAVDTFGTNDKMVLILSMGLVAAIASAVIGLIALRSLRTARILILSLAVVMGVCILTRAGADPIDLLPLVLGTAAGVFAVGFLLPSRERSTAAAGLGAEPAVGADRRTFLIRAVVLTGAAGLATVGGKVFALSRDAAVAVRQALKLPAAKVKAVPLPEGVQAPVDGVEPFVTSNDNFYRIDTALIPPEIDPANWQLRVHGMVEQEFTMSFAELLAQDLVESYVTLTCVSNVVGGNLVGNAKWLGYPVRQVLARARPLPGADMVLSTSKDGFSASTPLPVLQDDRDALLAVGMNGEPLPLNHGFPVRMVVPGLYGYVSATKWVVDLEVTTFAQQSAYWTTRGWSAHGPIKTASRVEVPRALARIPLDSLKDGALALGGTAWAQTRGISKVEIQLDGGEWREAVLASEASVDTWRQWSYLWDGATQGDHQVAVRAYDGTGTLQVADQAPPEPDGATGWHTIRFTLT